jgi:hypothetical protein
MVTYSYIKTKLLCSIDDLFIYWTKITKPNMSPQSLEVSKIKKNKKNFEKFGHL